MSAIFNESIKKHTRAKPDIFRRDTGVTLSKKFCQNMTLRVAIP